MELGMIGLGRMGANLVRRLLRDGHHAVVYDVDPASVAELVAEGAAGASGLEDLAGKLTSPRAIWIMVPAGVTGRVIEDIAAHLEAGDIIVDGGNSFYQDDLGRGAARRTGICLIDVGTSGGVFGLDRGFCLMIGGDTDAVTHLDPIFRSLAPGVDAALRTAGREDEPSTAEHGYLHCGPSGAGHFVKMIHNGIEYGLMAAYAEGLNILKHAGLGRADQAAVDAETAPLRHPEHYRYEFDIPAMTEVWRRGSVIASWLLDLTAAAFVENPTLEGFAGRVSDSGEGRWTVLSAVEEGVPAPVLSAALYGRFDSRDETTSPTTCCRRCVSNSAATRSDQITDDHHLRRRVDTFRDQRRSRAQEVVRGAV